MPMNMNTEDRKKIEDLVNKLVLGWAEANPEVMKEAWDLECSECFMVLPEVDQPMFGAEAIKQYYDALGKEFPDVRVTIENLTISPLGGHNDLALISFELPTHVIMPGYSSQRKTFMALDFMVFGRASALVRRSKGEWRLIHYHESIPWKPPV